MIYFILLFCCLLACSLSPKNKKRQQVFALFFLVVMMLLVGARDPSVGVDSERYADKLYFAHDFSWLSYEPLFQLSINFINSTWCSVLAWFMYLSFLAYFFYTVTILKYSENAILSVLVFMVSILHFFPDTMNNLRQGISIMLLLISYIKVAEKKYWVTAIFFLLALGFHMSSLLVLPFYFICLKDFSKSQILSILIFTFLFGFISAEILNARGFVSRFSFTSELLMEGADKFSDHLENTEYALNWMGHISFLAPINLLCYLLVPSGSDSRMYKYLFNFYFWGTVVGNLICGVIPFGARYLVLFLVVESLLFVYKYNKAPYLKAYLVFLILSYIVYLYRIANMSKPGMIIPYKLNPEVYSLIL